MSSPSGLVTLYDMIKFNAFYAVSVCSNVARIEGKLSASAGTDEARKREITVIDQDSAQSMIGNLTKLGADFEKSQFHSSADGAYRLLKRLSDGGTTQAECGALQGELARRLQDDLRRRKFYQLKPEVARYFELKEPFGEQVAQSFRTAAFDLEEACKCYACERFDATVFHLMRAMESPLRCLARNLHVRYTPGWAGYINKIDKKLRQKTRIPKKRREFLSNASTLMWAVKEAWRNETMHLESHYGPDQTTQIFESSRAFMMHLATQLKETP